MDDKYKKQASVEMTVEHYPCTTLRKDQISLSQKSKEQQSQNMLSKVPQYLNSQGSHLKSFSTHYDFRLQVLQEQPGEDGLQPGAQMIES